MDQRQLRDLAKDFLEPLISGSKLEDSSVASPKKDQLVGLDGPCRIRFKAEKTDAYRLVLHRSQPFEKIKAGLLTESDVVAAFVVVVKAMKKGLRASYSADLRTTFPRRVVAKALGRTTRHEEVLLGAIDQLVMWAGQQYEGKLIPAAIGFVPGNVRGFVTLDDMCQESFSSVLSNGYDTILTCDFAGCVTGLEALPPHTTAIPFAPYRLGAIAQWATTGRIALVLNRSGEILVFRDQELRFVRRGGHWHFLTHSPVITQMGRTGDHNVRRAVYSTSLDASFARTGACIGVVSSSHAGEWQAVVASTDDHLSLATSTKARVLTSIVQGKKFQDLDRRLRQELVAIDGATVIDHKGNVLAIGAIVKIPGGSSGGGRLAAAQELGVLGLGIKVSQDGGISGYRDGHEEPKFSVM